ncbi:transcriptional regulator [Bacillus anthracis]|uniref:ArsR/SmtB family transcription factor n=1 Tax=Bacillus anthracis TaxID=1392 RepID=UPI002DB6A387|nr:transcriptional regulator [Bacillus anthracis]MEB9506432.1 transcriptional regulator [Bacillus anthracis]
MKNRQISVSAEDVEMLKVLANPIRLQIVVILMQYNTLNVTDLVLTLQTSEPSVSISQAAASQNLAKMRGGILGYDKIGAEVYYYISNPKAPKIVEVLLTTIK